MLRFRSVSRKRHGHLDSFLLHHSGGVMEQSRWMASSTFVGRHRDRRCGLYYSVVTDQLFILRPATAASAEHPGRADTAVIVRSADHDDTAIGRERDRRY